MNENKNAIDRKPYFMIVFYWLMAASVQAADLAIERETLIWKEIPVEVPINIDHERVLSFPHDVQPWVPSSIKGSLTVEAIGKNIYLKALTAFTPVRIKVRSLDHSRYYLLDVKAGEFPGLARVLEIIPQDLVTVDVSHISESNNDNHELDWNLRLIRYAAQQLYVPDQFQEGDKIVSAPLSKGLPQIPLIRGGKVKATPIARWKSPTAEALYVTALRLENRTNDVVLLDHKHSIRGNFIASCFHHNQLNPISNGLSRGDNSHTTTLYVTHKQPF